MSWSTRQITAGLFVLAVVLVAASMEARRDDGRWWLFTLLMVVGLVIARIRPLTAVLLTAAGSAGHHLPEQTGTEAIDLAVPIALLLLAASDVRRRTATGVCLVMLAIVAAASMLQPEDIGDSLRAPDSSEAAVHVRQAPAPPGVSLEESLAHRLWDSSGNLFALAAAYLLGDNMRRRRLHLHTLERRAADLEREQQQRVALATAAERARLTRELHDVVAHSLSVMVVQAQGAAAALRRHPERSETALRHIVGTGRTSLAEMRRLLAIVRDGPELAPQPGADTLPTLIDGIRATGTEVGFTVSGTPVPLPAAVDLSAYRITQEALTNTLKHAGPGARADVHLTYHPMSLEVRITDDGVPPPPGARSGTVLAAGVEAGSTARAGHEGRSGADGNGLRGIAERVRLLDGTLKAGPGRDGGFQVMVVLPLQPMAGSEPETSAASPGARAATPGTTGTVGETGATGIPGAAETAGTGRGKGTEGAREGETARASGTAEAGGTGDAGEPGGTGDTAGAGCVVRSVAG
ncbi:MAG TPA: histidine kinase [Actinoplanes sp.]|nr:histidine kinase [Actinoplanes sp.]